MHFDRFVYFYEVRMGEDLNSFDKLACTKGAEPTQYELVKFVARNQMIVVGVHQNVS